VANIEIENIDSLRRHAISTLRKLDMRSIDIEEAAATSKLYENIISTLKSELEYNKFMQIKKDIPFLESVNYVQPISLSAKSSGKLLNEMKAEKTEERKAG